MHKTNRETRKQAEMRGRRSEALAALLLRCKGYRILGRRVRTRAGEIDLVAKSPAGVICFVEVKARPDDGLAAEAEPPSRWLKITGRYQILNIQSLLDECRRDGRAGLIIDQVPRAGMARTYSFCAATDFYRNRLLGLYRQCDDRTGAWIERILFRELTNCPAKEVHLFATQPRIRAVAGSSGAAFPTGRGQWLAKQTLRRLNRFADRQYLWYPK